MRAAAWSRLPAGSRDTARFNEVLIAANDADAAGGSCLQCWSCGRRLPELMRAPCASLAQPGRRIAASEDRADGDESANR